MSPHRSRRMSNSYNEIPVGILALQKVSRQCCPNSQWNRQIVFKASILGLTYISYTCYHMSRKPISVVKSVLQGNCTNASEADCGYPPFNGSDAGTLLGALDSAFLFFYAGAMFISGFVAERVSLRYFLSLGMILSAIFTYLFGIAKTSNIHSIYYFLFVQACAGVFQTTGWPGVVTLVGRWFGRSKRGLIFGIWNSHTSIGNILGTVIAAHYVETDWALSFIVPSIIMAAVGFALFLFIAESPEIVGCQTQRQLSAERLPNDSDAEDGNEHEQQYDAEVNYRPSERTPILQRNQNAPSLTERPPISLIDALNIPGVIEFSLCLFFSKLVSYTFLYWLPLYIQTSSTLGAQDSADLSVVFDVGGVVGAIAAGMISDISGMSATTCIGMLFLASPALLLVQQYCGISIIVCGILLFVVGILVNGPYALITTSVSAELGQHHSLEGNAKALATVTAIIDGTGSIGAAIGPLLAGVISNEHGWQHVFYMLIVANILAMISLVRLAIKEFAKFRRVNRIRIE